MPNIKLIIEEYESRIPSTNIRNYIRLNTG